MTDINIKGVQTHEQTAWVIDNLFKLKIIEALEERKASIYEGIGIGEDGKGFNCYYHKRPRGTVIAVFGLSEAKGTK